MKRIVKIIIFLLVIVLGLTLSSSVLSNPPPQPPPPQLFQAMREEAGGDLEAYWDEATGVPRFLSGRIPSPPGPDAEAIARGFLRRYKNLYKMRDPDAELSTLRVATDRIGMDHVRFQQVYQGLPVFGAQMITHLRGKEITSVNGAYIPEIEVSVEPALSGEEAIEIAKGDLGDEEAVLSEEGTELGIYHDGEEGHLAWQLRLFSYAPLGRWVYFVDAHEGQIILKFNTIDTAKRILTYDAENGTSLPGTLVCDSDIDPTCTAGDTVEQNTHNNASDVYDYYSITFTRDSYDGAGATLTSTVHYGVAYNNAFWNGTQTVYGDGDEVTFSPLGEDLDIVTHEWTHAVTQYSANLWYIHQSGALNESYSDVFAAMNDTDGNEWWMGEASYTPGTPGDALRYMDDPHDPAHGGANWQPRHMDEYLYLPYEVDNGGVHINSGIPNNAAYFIAIGGTHPDSGISVTGIGLTKTEQIYYQTLTQYLTPTSRFLDAAYASVQACQDLVGSYGIIASDCDSVQNGFGAVGLGSEVMTGLTNYIYLPLVTKKYGYVCTGSGTQLLQNTGFESGNVIWVQTSGTYIIISSAGQPTWTGAWSAWFTGYNYADDRLYQAFYVPGGYGSAQLEFWVGVASDDHPSVPYDYFYVELQDSSGNTIGSSIGIVNNTHQGYWYPVTLTWYEFEPYTNQTLRVHFRGTNDVSGVTHFFLDDVTFKIYCGYEAPSDYVPATPMEPVVQVERGEAISSIPPEAMELRE